MAVKYEKSLDVICMIGGDGTVVPIRIRIEDDEGERQTYTIQEYTDLSHQGTKTMHDGIYVTDDILVFDCKIIVFGRPKNIMLYYDASKSKWTMSA